MKAEDVEVGKTYVMLEDEKDTDGTILVAKGHRVVVIDVYLDSWLDVRAQDVEKDKYKSGVWMVASTHLGEIEITTDKYEQHRQLCEKIHSTYVAKNKDYGDSFTRTRAEAKYPELVIITRLSDKFYRLKTLLEGAEQQVKSESINDTLLDLANYCLMELLERQNGGGK